MKVKNEKIKLKNGRIVTMGEFFKTKEQFHEELSRLPIEEKIKILMKMWKIVELKRIA